jgi:hypothetical protein
VDQDRADRVRLLVRSEVEKIVRHRLPYADRLVGFTCVGREDMLENRLDGLGHIVIRNGSEIVVLVLLYFAGSGPTSFTP